MEQTATVNPFLRLWLILGLCFLLPGALAADRRVIPWWWHPGWHRPTLSWNRSCRSAWPSMRP